MAKYTQKLLQHFFAVVVGFLLLTSCVNLSTPSLEERGGLAADKVSGRSYTTADNKIRILFNNPWVQQSLCDEDTEICDVDAGTSPERTDNHADARSINNVLANLIMQSAVDVSKGYLPQGTELDIATQDLDNNRIIEALEFVIENGVHVRFVGNRYNDNLDYQTDDTETVADNPQQYYPVKSSVYDASASGFVDIAQALDDFFPITYYDGGDGEVEVISREEFPIDESDPADGESYDSDVVNRFFFMPYAAGDTNQDGISDFNLVNLAGQMHHKFMLIKTRKRDKAGLPVSDGSGNPVIEYHTVTGSANMTDNGFYRNNNNIIIFVEERAFVSTDGDGNGLPDREEVDIAADTNRCPLDNPTTKPCLYNTYKRQMNYLLTDYDNDFQSAANGALTGYNFDSETELDVHFADYQSEPIIPKITNEVLQAKEGLYFMVFSFSTSTYGNDQGVALHEAIWSNHPRRGLIEVKGLLSPDRSENITTMSSVPAAEIYEYDNRAADPDFSLGGGRLHHKVMVIDPCSSSGVVVTGSANWSKTVDGLAEGSLSYSDPDGATPDGSSDYDFDKGTHNNEDIIIIRNSEVARIYYEKEFVKLAENVPALKGEVDACR